jgi:hypothetical protein
MYRRLRAIDPEYPMYTAFVTGGHFSQRDNAAEFRYTNELANQFLDAFVFRRGEGAPAERAISFRTEPSPSGDRVPLTASGWDQLTKGAVRLSGEGSRVTSSVPSPAEVTTDPVLRSQSNGLLGPTITEATGTYDPTTGWTWGPISSGGLTLLGLPRVTLNYEFLTGREHGDATVVAKLWDVDPLGNRSLITRGVYRLSALAGNALDGTLSFQLFGNHWHVPGGHSITLEVSQTDAAFLRPDSLQSSLRFTSPQLALPAVEGFADLQVTDCVASNNRSSQGHKVTLTATITNTGAGDSGVSSAEFRLDDGTLLGTVSTPSVPAGSSVVVSLEWLTASLRGQYVITVTSDSQHAVPESNEQNNSATLTVTLRGNRVTNGSFEQASHDGSGPHGWSSTSTAAGTAHWNEAAGTVAFRGTGRSVAPSGSPTWTSDPVDVLPGEILNLTATVQSSGASSVSSVSLIGVDLAGLILNTIPVLRLATTDGFVTVSEQLIIPTGVVRVRIVLSGFSAIDPTTSGEVLFSDIGLFGPDPLSIDALFAVLAAEEDDLLFSW